MMILLSVNKFLLELLLLNQMTLQDRYGYELATRVTLVYRLQINRTLYLSKFPSAALSSVGVATATPPFSALQNENLSCAYSPVIWKTLY